MNWSLTPEVAVTTMPDNGERRAGTKKLMRWNTRDQLTLVATIYRAAARAGNPPTRAVADHFQISITAAQNRVARARRAGFLAPTRRGAKTVPDPRV